MFPYLKKLETIHLRVLCAKFDQNWHSGYEEEDFYKFRQHISPNLKLSPHGIGQGSSFEYT